MRIRNRMLPTLMVSALAGGQALGQESLVVTVDLPDTETWTLVTDKASGPAYSREWVPAGQNAETAQWLIAQQKIPVDGGLSAVQFLEQLYEDMAGACTSASHDDLDRHRIGDFRGAVGRTMCAQRRNEQFGAFSDQIVFVEDGFAYIVTSEIRIEPMVVAGVISFQTPGAALSFRDRDELSRNLVREGVRVERN